MVSSEKLAGASYEARWLWVLLVASQDDAGAFPWFPLRVRSLTVGTDWPLSKAASLRDELVRAGLARMDGPMLVLYRGAELNGVPKSGGGAGKVRLYPRPT